METITEAQALRFHFLGLINERQLDRLISPAGIRECGARPGHRAPRSGFNSALKLGRRFLSNHAESDSTPASLLGNKKSKNGAKL